MKSRWIAAAAAAAILSWGPVSPALAGWMIQEVDPEFPNEATTYWFQEGQVRVEGVLEGLTILINLKKEEGYLVDRASKRYAGGKLADLSEQLRKLEADALPPGAETAADAADKGAAPAPAEPERPGTVEVKDVGPGERLLGYDTRQYQVRVDGDLLEDILVAPKIDVQREVDLPVFSTTMQKMLGGSGVTQGYENTPEYRAIAKGGYPVRQVLSFMDQKSTLEVRKAEAKRFPPEDFVVPPGFAKIGYVELLIGQEE
jgi:hypothetical protein